MLSGMALFAAKPTAADVKSLEICDAFLRNISEQMDKFNETIAGNRKKFDFASQQHFLALKRNAEVTMVMSNVLKNILELEIRAVPNSQEEKALNETRKKIVASIIPMAEKLSLYKKWDTKWDTKPVLEWQHDINTYLRILIADLSSLK